MIVDKYVLPHIYGFALYVTQMKKDETNKIALKKKNDQFKPPKSISRKQFESGPNWFHLMYENITFVLHWNSDNIVVFCSMGFGDFSMK